MEQAVDEQPGVAPGSEIPGLWAAGRVEEARLRLLSATKESVHRFLRHMLRDDQLAEDLFQDAYIRAFAALGSYRGESSVTSWMLTIARNVALNRLRRQRLERRWTTTGEELSDLENRAVRNSGPVLVGSGRALEAALAALPPSQREAVMMFYGDDLSVEEVARVTGRPANTIKSDLRRARLALRGALGEEP